ncbi:MAG: hypothetical protein HYW69_01295 [Candidatus Nealsonbacteria bacterium]|nr:hypothetical protein [Candidatus Nealsonbacteria bacterium]
MKTIGGNKDSPFRFVDPVLCVAMFFIVILIIFLLLPTSKEDPKKSEVEVLGSLTITAEWPPSYPQDIDLWVEGPDRDPVGYSRAGSSIFSYLRDDLGKITYDDLNYELALAQSIKEGEYIVNLHFYAYHGGRENVPVQVTVILYSPGNVSLIFKGEVVLGKAGDELTVVRFRLDENNDLVPGSINSDFTPVRNKKTFTQ